MWHGTGHAGSGSLSSDSGVLSDTPYSFRTRFENEKGTNPEELIAAAHAGCFSMALAFGLQAAGFTPTELSTEAAVTLDQDGAGIPHQPLSTDLARQGAKSWRRGICSHHRRGREELSDVQGSQRRYHLGREVDPLTANSRSPGKG
jgi:OsmC subfamily peroxiredoxin